VFISQSVILIDSAKHSSLF